MTLWSLTITDVLTGLGRDSAARLACVCGDERLTFRDVAERSGRLARVLTDLGVRPGGRVLWLGRNCHRVLETFLACARIGAVCCPANWRQTAAEVTATISDFRADVVLWQEDSIGDLVREARNHSGAPGRWVRADGTEDGCYEELVAAAGDAPPPVDDASLPVLGIYTAAFHGTPHCALLDHTAIINQDFVVAAAHQIDASTVYLNCGPMFHVGTLMSTLATFHVGGVNVFLPKADAETICRTVEQERVTRAFLVEPTRQQIVDLVAERGYDLSTLLGWPGSPQWEATVNRDPSPWSSSVGGYGQTETMGHVTFRFVAAPCQGEHGRPTPITELRVVDDDMVDLSTGETGEIVVRGPTVMTGYHDRAQENADRRAGGWHHTGDLGRREPDGSLTFVGPRARMLKSGVENIYPAEVEACIRAHPDVADCAVIGIPDQVWVQSVKAVVVTRAGCVLRTEDVIEHCRSLIASYKKPRVVEFTDALPRVATGIDYAALDERFGGGVYPGGATRAVG
jgi:long-chain acyl-CoA synthetase